MKNKLAAALLALGVTTAHTGEDNTLDLTVTANGHKPIYTSYNDAVCRTARDNGVWAVLTGLFNRNALLGKLDHYCAATGAISQTHSREYEICRKDKNVADTKAHAVYTKRIGEISRQAAQEEWSDSKERISRHNVAAERDNTEIANRNAASLCFRDDGERRIAAETKAFADSFPNGLTLTLGENLPRPENGLVYAVDPHVLAQSDYLSVDLCNSVETIGASNDLGRKMSSYCMESKTLWNEKLAEYDRCNETRYATDLVIRARFTERMADIAVTGRAEEWDYVTQKEAELAAANARTEEERYNFEVFKHCNGNADAKMQSAQLQVFKRKFPRGLTLTIGE